MQRPAARLALVVEVGQLVELVRSEQPEVQERAGEAGVHLARRELDQGGEWQGHLLDLGVEGWVALGPPAGYCGVGVVCLLLILVLAVGPAVISLVAEVSHLVGGC